CEVLDQVDDLAAFYADRRLDLVTGDHRPRIGGEYFHGDPEVGQLALDQSRRVIDRLAADDVLCNWRVFEQSKRRQRRVGQFLEKWSLSLFHNALGPGRIDRRGDDEHRLVLG